MKGILAGGDFLEASLFNKVLAALITGQYFSVICVKRSNSFCC